MKKTKTNTEHYYWGDNCSGWNLMQSKELHIIEELMPPNTQEKMHYHKFAPQFFYILEGKATFEFEDKIIELKKGEGVHILPKIKHRVKNRSTEDLKFLLTSQPSARGDRIEEPFET